MVRNRPDRAATKLTNYELGLYGSADYLNRRGESRDREALQEHNLLGCILDIIYARELDHIALVSKAALPTPVQISSWNSM
jgi:hypothetical protein